MADELQIKLERLRPQPGDLVVITLPETAGGEQLEQTADLLQKWDPKEHGWRAIVLVGDPTVQLLRGTVVAGDSFDEEFEEDPGA